MNEDIRPLTWWGYLHVNGTIQPKRYFGPRDIEDALASDFVARVFPPFQANSRSHAIEIIQGIINETKINS